MIRNVINYVFLFFNSYERVRVVCIGNVHGQRRHNIRACNGIGLLRCLKKYVSDGKSKKKKKRGRVKRAAGVFKRPILSE